jgi:4-amino-4-deoxy-L-arabinose transferase-like glycosyltransferase
LLLVAWAGRRLYGELAGLHAALILGSGTLFYLLAHINTLDMGLTFYLTAAMLSFVFAQRDTASASIRRYCMWLTWLMLGLATLQKGLVAVALPGFALVLYTLVQRDWRLWLRLQLLAGLVLVLAVNLPWWLLMAKRNAGFVDFFFVHEHYTRFVTTEHGRSQPWWYFGALLSVGLLPWIAPVIRGALSGWRAPPQQFSVERFMLLWSAAVFIFYSPSGSKLAPYILPMIPPLALLAGRFLAALEPAAGALTSTLLLSAVMAIGLMSLPLVAAHLKLPVEHRGGYEKIAELGLLAGMLLALATALAAVLARRRARLSAVATLATGLMASLALFTNGSNELERWRGGTLLAADIAPHLAADTPLYCLDMYPQTTIFTLARTCVVVGDYGELETQFDDGEVNWLPAEAFIAAWRAAPRAVAVIDPATWPRWQALQIPANIVATKPYAIVITKPQ